MNKETLKHAVIAALMVASGVTINNVAFEDKPELTPQTEITDAELENDIHAYAVDITYRVTLPVQYADEPGLPGKPAFVELYTVDKNVIIKKTSTVVADLKWIRANVPPLDSTYQAVSVSRLRLIQ